MKKRAIRNQYEIILNDPTNLYGVGVRIGRTYCRVSLPLLRYICERVGFQWSVESSLYELGEKLIDFLNDPLNKVEESLPTRPDWVPNLLNELQNGEQKTPIKLGLPHEDNYQIIRNGEEYITDINFQSHDQEDEPYNNLKMSVCDGVVAICDNAMPKCDDQCLKKVKFPKSLRYIGDNFVMPSNKILFAEGLEYIGNNSFVGYEDIEISVKTLKFPTTLRYIGQNSFTNLCNLTSITIPKSVEYIGQGTFAACMNVSEVNIEGDTFRLDGGTLYQGDRQIATFATLVPEEIVIPHGTTQIDDNQYRFGTNITSVVIPHTVTKIGATAFALCTSLRSITIPQSVTEISEFAFFGCSSLTSVTIADSVAEIGRGAFWECSALNEVRTQGNLKFENGVLINGDKLLHIFKSQVTGDVVIPSGVTFIDVEFSDCTQLRSITIPDSVIAISPEAFRGCTSLSSITIPQSVIEIGNGAFNRCDALKEVRTQGDLRLENGLLVKGQKCLYIFKSQVAGDVVLPSEVGDFDFSGCSAITSVVIPDSVTKIGRNAFYGCTSLRSITIPDSVSDIGWDAFEDCDALVEVKTQGKLKLDNWMLVNGEDILYVFETKVAGTVTIPSGVTQITQGAFVRCSEITSIIIPHTVTEIEAEAFGGCTSLRSITIPDSVSEIGWDVFWGCESLQEIITTDGNGDRLEDLLVGEDGENNRDVVDLVVEK